jgi:hypothetical protein
MGSPFANCIYYKRCCNGTWDFIPMNLRSIVSSGDIVSNDAFSGYYRQGGRQNCSFIGLAYQVGNANSYNITFAYLSLYDGHAYMYDGRDLQLFLQCYKGQVPPEIVCLADLGGGIPPQFFKQDGKVDGKDMALFIKCYKGEGPKT